MDPVIRARSLMKRYAASNETAVDGIDFAVRDRECFGFLGPNGAGKTTTMSMISCRVHRTAGELTVLGLDPEERPREIKAAIGVVPQENFPDFMLNVEENLLIHANYFGIDKTDARNRTRELLEFVQLQDRGNWHVQNLSGGMKRRLLIARALINRPSLLVLDEPTTGLDPQARHLVWERLRDLKRRGVTLIITTHYMEEAAQLCDRLVIMHRGKILVEGSPQELISTHVAPEVVELTAVDLAPLEKAVAARGLDSERAGDRLIAHTDDAETLLKELGAARIDYESALVRPAGLEDVFLKLTGRRLEE
jgi:lipooligosaccharide transport system ATP-binding protein